MGTLLLRCFRLVRLARVVSPGRQTDLGFIVKGFRVKGLGFRVKGFRLKGFRLKGFGV